MASSSTAPSGDDISEMKITDRMSMKGKTILVTGGGRGIGFAVCKAIAQLGGDVAVLDTLPEPVAEFQTLAERYGTKAMYRTADVTRQASLESAFHSVLEEAGSLQGCVTAAGIAIDKPFVEHEWQECQNLLNVNVMGTFWTARLVAAHIIARTQRMGGGGGGSIVMIASIAAQGVKIAKQNVAIYNMSKAAVKGLAGPLAVELAADGIRVNTISPGVIRSPMTDALKEIDPGLLDMFNNATPLKRMGVPQDLTPAVVYLLSDAASFTTGADFIISGGYHAGISPSWLA